MPAVVMEGRRVINNLERSAALFITKNVFSLLYVLSITIPFGALFPLEPSQFTLFNMMLIGAPSFVLAMEANKKIVKGRFLVNVFRNALPAGLTSFIALAAMSYVALQGDVTALEKSTMSLIIITFVGFLMLYTLCRPLNTLRIALIITMLVGFTVGAIAFGYAGVLTVLSGSAIWITVITCLCAVPVYLGLNLLFKSLKFMRG